MSKNVLAGVNSCSQLKEGETVTENFTFSPEWCESFLRISGDSNFDLHSMEGLQIVQGTAIITSLSPIFCKYLSKFGLVGFESFYPKAKIYIGDTVTIQIRRLDEKTRLTRVEVVVLRGDKELVKTVVRMINKKYLKGRE